VESADVVIIGGGAVGAATAFQLALKGITNVVLLERGQLAGGSTAKSAGGARLQFADELNIRIGERGMRDFESWTELIGAHVDFVPDIAFHQVGYLFLLSDDQQLATFRAALQVQQRLGVPSRELTPAEAGAIVPQLVTDDLVGATFCPRDGHMSPEAVVQGYAAAAAAHGVSVRQGVTVTGINVTEGRITGVETDAGTITTDTVVSAAGAWSREVGALAGVEIPVDGEARWMFFSPQNGGLGDDLPLTIDFGTGFYTHREGPGIVFGGREAELEDIAVHALHRLPVIGELPIQSQWWGYYDNSPDHNAIVGATDLPGLYVGTGFSGHGFQQSPAVGEHLAELISGTAISIPMEPFGLDRFSRGEQRVETFIV
jgi:glycine/D-amino acid oxidase-like deaminating enzyme